MPRGLLALLALGCAPPEAPVTPADYEEAPVLNPELPDGRIVYRGFGDHHPECFAFVGESRRTETVSCPEGAISLLETCPGGRLYGTDGKRGCVCVPEDGEPRWVDCPR